jgi:hypothetical protein
MTSQREGIWEKEYGPIGSLQAGFRIGLHPLWAQMRGFHDLREKPFSLLMLL